MVVEPLGMTTTYTYKLNKCVNFYDFRIKKSNTIAALNYR